MLQHHVPELIYRHRIHVHKLNGLIEDMCCISLCAYLWVWYMFVYVYVYVHVYVWQALKLNDFNIVTMVGAGSFGQVFQVRKKDTNQVFALKVLDKSHLRKIDQVQNTKQVLCLLVCLCVWLSSLSLGVAASMSLSPCFSLHVSPFICLVFSSPHVSFSTSVCHVCPFIHVFPSNPLSPCLSFPPLPFYVYFGVLCVCVLLSHKPSRSLPRSLVFSPAFSRVFSLSIHAHTHTHTQ